MATLSRNTALKTFPGLKQSDLEDLPCSWRSCHGNSYPMYQRSDVDKVVAAKRAGDKGFAAAQDKQATAAAVSKARKALAESTARTPLALAPPAPGVGEAAAARLAAAMHPSDPADASDAARGFLYAAGADGLVRELRVEVRRADF